MHRFLSSLSARAQSTPAEVTTASCFLNAYPLHTRPTQSGLAGRRRVAQVDLFARCSGPAGSGSGGVWAPSWRPPGSDRHRGGPRSERHRGPPRSGRHRGAPRSGRHPRRPASLVSVARTCRTCHSIRPRRTVPHSASPTRLTCHADAHSARLAGSAWSSGVSLPGPAAPRACKSAHPEVRASMERAYALGECRTTHAGKGAGGRASFCRSGHRRRHRQTPRLGSYND